MLSNCDKIQEKKRELENLLNISATLHTKNGIQRLQAKIKSELNFLERLLKRPTEIKDEHLRSSNLSYLSAIVSCIKASHNVEEVMKPVCLHSPKGQEYHMTVDVVADYGKTWIKVVARNPQALLQSTLGAGGYGRRTLMEQIYDLKECSLLCPYMYEPPVIKVWFAAGVDTKMKLLLDKMHVACVGTVLESSPTSLLAEDQNSDGNCDETDSLPEFSLKSCNKWDRNLFQNEGDLRNSCTNKTVLSLEEIPATATLNLDVSTMIAHVSALTNGGCHFIYQEDILTEQGQREREAPVRPTLDGLFQGRKLVCCETAHKDFVDIVNTVGGPGEKRRAQEFLSEVTVLPDQPSAQALALDISSKVKTRSRIVFGTGDTLKAVTVTANQGFLRAAEAQGFQVVSFLHESRALTEMKEETGRPVSPCDKEVN